MSTPLPGQIRCPTCHRSTPPTAFCTQCGSPIPASARARPRGFDRDELQDRVRGRRPGDIFRRGAPAGDGMDEGRSAYRPFRPEPEDELLHPGGGAAPEEGAAHVDNTPPGFDDRPPPRPVEPPAVQAPPPPSPPAPVARPAVEPPPAAAPPPEAALPAPVGTPPPAVAAPPPAPPIREPVHAAPPDPPPPPADDGGPYDDFEPYEYRYATSPRDRDRPPGGMSPLAIGGFVLLGILAIGVGAFISGIFAGGVAQATPTPTPSATAAPTATPEVTPLESTSPSAAATPAPSLPPFTFPDGFTARTEPCADQPVSDDGCDSSGASVSGGSVWVWVGVRKGTGQDVLGVDVVNALGQAVGHGSLALRNIGCDDSCTAWGRFRFGGLAPGDYTIEVDRNGEPAAEASFTVTG